MKRFISGLARGCATAVAGILLIASFPDGRMGTLFSAAFAEAPDAAETQSYEDAKALGTVEAWDAFLAHYPTGFHADLARAYVKQLAAAPKQTSGSEQPAYEQTCEGQEGLRSRASIEPAKLRFINESGATLVLQWIDFNGALKEYGTLAPGAEITQDTFITHPWIVAYGEGSCRQIFLPAPGVSVARLGLKSQLPNKASTASTEISPPLSALRQMAQIQSCAKPQALPLIPGPMTKLRSQQASLIPWATTTSRRNITSPLALSLRCLCPKTVQAWCGWNVPPAPKPS